VQASVNEGALSVDHLEVLTDQDIQALQGSDTMPVALPGCSLFIKIPYTPARQIIEAGLPLALATDFNPGSCPSGNMNLVMSLACFHMGMTPEEALNASTINAAYAMGLSETHGSLALGRPAHFILTQPINEWAEIPYYFGSNKIKQLYISGKAVKA
jgi:imidazolonepropionase